MENKKASESDVFRMALIKRKDWTAEEISEAYQIYDSYKGKVFDWFRFIEGTIENFHKTENKKASTNESDRSQIKNSNNLEMSDAEK